MARIEGDFDVFFRKDNLEAYLTPIGNVVRMLKEENIYLGEQCPLEEIDVEKLRLSRAVDLLQKSGGQLLKRTREKNAGQRLEKLLRKVFEFDRENFSKKRSIHNGLLVAEARDLLLNFDFNTHSRPGKVLGNAVKVDFEKGSLCIPDFSPALLLSKATNTSRLKARFLLSRVDFLNGEYTTYMGKELVLSAASPNLDLTMNIGHAPKGDGFLFGYLWLGFERDDAAAVPELLWRVDDVFRVMGFSSEY